MKKLLIIGLVCMPITACDAQDSSGNEGPDCVKVNDQMNTITKYYRLHPDKVNGMEADMKPLRDKADQLNCYFGNMTVE